MGLKPGAAVNEIKKTYRKLSVLIHPNKNSNSAESIDAFKLLEAIKD